ncbi:MAG: polysaccharide transporter [Leptolyngbyaceae cyanobacterium RU_5_1]|nr:polysaccharide transporter [Leptolyngbyaceae cyanobacterium RU_5_1]
MIRRNPRSIAGLALSVLVGTAHSLPVLAQTPATQPSAQSPAVTPQNPNQLTPDQDPFIQPASPPAEPNLIRPTTEIVDSYTLGPGDIVRVDIFDILPSEITLEPRYTILPDGTLNLPWVGTVNVQGLTLRQAGNALAARYSRFIRNPVITISLVAPRPLKVGVIGEVNRPGAYIISVISNEVTQQSLNQRTTAEGGNQYPRVSQAIQTAGGITQLANIRQVRVKRPQAKGEPQIIAIDFWKFLQEGDLQQDILLRDGDTVIIPKATTLDALEATQVAASNFSPETITVNVVGEVFTPGALKLKPNTTLNQAVMAAGGLKGGRASRKKIDLIRLNPNGTVTRRRLTMDLDQNLNDLRNPPLHNNDIVVVNRTAIAAAGDFLQTAIGAPLTIFGGISGFMNLLGR